MNDDDITAELGDLDIDHIVDIAITNSHTVLSQPSEEMKSQYHTITPEQYTEFEVYYTWAALKGMRYGQAFCTLFGISDASPLYFFKTFDVADRWIRSNYLVKA